MRLITLAPLGVWLYAAVGALGLYWALGWRSLVAHLRVIRLALAQGELEAAREAVGRVVSRDCREASWSELRRAALESALENTNDAIVAPLFWFAALGLPGVVLYRLSNTLDALWGYRNERFQAFGWAAARVDDGLNWLPARLTALAFVATAPGFNAARLAARAWLVQARRCESPNGGPVMCAGAGALGVALGGPAWYHGQIKDKPWFGGTREPDAADLPRAQALIHRAVGVLLALMSVALLGVALWPWTR
jgi:adenosylcobinamide-phosphate synthase